MNVKLVLIGMLTAAGIFVFSDATWANRNGDHYKITPKQKHYRQSKHDKPVQSQIHRRKTNPDHDKKDHYRHRIPNRVDSDRHMIPKRVNRPKPSLRRHYKHRPYYKHYLYRYRPAKKQRHVRPKYSRADDSESMPAATSHLSWSIKIVSKD